MLIKRPTTGTRASPGGSPLWRLQVLHHHRHNKFCYIAIKLYCFERIRHNCFGGQENYCLCIFILFLTLFENEHLLERKRRMTKKKTKPHVKGPILSSDRFVPEHKICIFEIQKNRQRVLAQHHLSKCAPGIS